MAIFTLQWQSLVAATETMCPAKPKICTFCPLHKKFVNSDLDYYLYLHQVLYLDSYPYALLMGS